MSRSTGLGNKEGQGVKVDFWAGFQGRNGGGGSYIQGEMVPQTWSSNCPRRSSDEDVIALRRSGFMSTSQCFWCVARRKAGAEKQQATNIQILTGRVALVRITWREVWPSGAEGSGCANTSSPRKPRDLSPTHEAEARKPSAYTGKGSRVWDKHQNRRNL